MLMLLRWSLLDGEALEDKVIAMRLTQIQLLIALAES